MKHTQSHETHTKEKKRKKDKQTKIQTNKHTLKTNKNISKQTHTQPNKQKHKKTHTEKNKTNTVPLASLLVSLPTTLRWGKTLIAFRLLQPICPLMSSIKKLSLTYSLSLLSSLNVRVIFFRPSGFISRMFVLEVGLGKDASYLAGSVSSRVDALAIFSVFFFTSSWSELELGE